MGLSTELTKVKLINIAMPAARPSTRQVTVVGTAMNAAHMKHASAHTKRPPGYPAQQHVKECYPMRCLQRGVQAVTASLLKLSACTWDLAADLGFSSTALCA